jgi:hypothetical protein
MTVSKRILLGFTAVLVAANGFGIALAGDVAAAPAGHHHKHHHHHHHHHHHKHRHQHCPTKKGKYPPGNCHIYFKHEKVHRKGHHGHHVKFQSGRVFKPGEKVTVVLHCPRVVKHKHGHKVVHHAIYKKEPTKRAHRGGSVEDRFPLPRHAHGTCTITLHGKKSHVTLKGKFKARR